MVFRLYLRKRINIIIIFAFLVFLSLPQIPSFAFNQKEEISSDLRKPKELTEKTTASPNAAFAKPLVYKIGPDDVLGISVWQNLSVQGQSTEKLKKREYSINKGDTLEISVWQWPDLIKDVIVRPDGKISFPLVGDIDAEGHTLTELDDILTGKLKEFIKSPEVSVMIKQFALAAGGNRGAVSFIKITDLSQDNVKVRPDGKISYPLIGDVQAEGESLDELREYLDSKITKIVNNSEVFVQVNEFGGNKVIILGEVPDPGVYKTSGSITILEALSLAGGYTKDAILRNVFVLRGDLNNPDVIRVNLGKAITGRDFSQNILIEPRDIIYVPKSLIADINYVLNQLIQPLTTSASAVPAIKIMRRGTSVKK